MDLLELEKALRAVAPDSFSRYKRAAEAHGASLATFVLRLLDEASTVHMRLPPALLGGAVCGTKGKGLLTYRVDAVDCEECNRG